MLTLRFKTYFVLPNDSEIDLLTQDALTLLFDNWMALTFGAVYPKGIHRHEGRLYITLLTIRQQFVLET